MGILRENSVDKIGYRDCQFNIWRISSIYERRQLTRNSHVPRQKLPIQLTDEDILEEILYQKRPPPQKKRKLHLSLKQTRILSTLLPDEVIKLFDLNGHCADNFVGVLLFADVSGFTSLCEKYKGFGKSGSDKLSVTLNNYFGAMVEVIYKHGGDVMKFSGDALLALWKLDSNEYMGSLIHRVVCCALHIQRSIGVYETDVKVLLKVKIAISAGNTTFAVIGNDNSRNYLVAGLPINEVKAAEGACTSGEVVLAPSAWGHLSEVNYEHYWKDNEYVKIIRIIYNPEDIKREIFKTLTKDSFQKSEFHFYGTLKKDTPKKKPGLSACSADVRTLIDEVSKRQLNSELKTFLIAPVIQQIDADLPMEYLSEMRNVTVMFINIIPNKLNTNSLINLVDQAYIKVCSLAYAAMGSVNKVSLFDKDVMMLIIFGLRGFTHEGEVAGCLKCGYNIRQACCTLEGVRTVSVGVTTGQAYCGVIGHPVRREYTVMGPVVNKAARIMCAYPGKVTCDRDTFMFSNLASSFFRIQEKKNLKGIENTGPIYEFTREKSKSTLLEMREGLYPLLGRKEEIDNFTRILDSIKNPRSWKRAILVTGEGRIGKSRLLDEMIIEAHNIGMESVAIELHPVHSTVGYGTAQIIIKQILEIPDSASVSEKEQKLSRALENHVPASDYWYLNDVMNVKFPHFEDGNPEIDPVRKFEQIKKIFHIILTQATSSSIFVIDDIDYCDEISWRLILSIIENRVKFLIMSMQKALRPTQAKYLKFPPPLEPCIVTITLFGIPDHTMAALACQILNVKAIPPELERVLIEKSNGNPGWCESFLLSLFQSNALKVEELPEWYIRSIGLIMPAEIYLKRKQYRTSDTPSSSETEEQKAQSTDNQAAKEEIASINQVKKKISLKKKLMACFKPKNNLKLGNNFYKFASGISQPEEAYEDLKQRIQQIRMRGLEPIIYNLEFNDNSSDRDITSEKELPSDGGDEVNEVDVKIPKIIEPSEPIDVKTFGPYGINEEIENQKITTDVVPRASYKTQSFENILKGIHQRYLRNRSTAIQESEMNSFLGEPRLQSLLDFREVEDIPARYNKKSSVSFEQIPGQFNSRMTREDPPKSDRSIPAETGLFPGLTSILWKSHTEFVKDASIKVFAKNKAKNEPSKEAQAFSKSVLDVPSTSLMQKRVSFPENATLGLELVKRTKNVLKPRNLQSRQSISQEAENVCRRWPASQCAQREKGIFSSRQKSNFDNPDLENGSDLKVLSNRQPKKRVSFAFARKKEIYPSNPSQEKARAWILDLLKFFKKPNRNKLRDSYVEVPIDFQFGETNTKLPAALISPNVKLEEVRIPEIFARKIMTVFDSLKPFEQLMLKCGSIIGERFTRKMLNWIMRNPNPFLTAEAVKRLFEMKILCCGSEVRKESFVGECPCFCQLDDGDIIDKTLPKYSFCHVFLFRYSLFRSTLYELLPLEQKREFHVRAVEFLQNEEIYCPSCQRFKQKRKDSTTVAEITEEVKMKRISSQGSFRLPWTEDDEDRPDPTQKSVKNKGSRASSKFNELFGLYFSSKIPRFQDCYCLSLHANTLGELINHCEAAGLREKGIDFILVYCSVMINLGEFEEAWKLLSQVEGRMKSSQENPFTNKKEKRFFFAFLYLLLGNLFLELGQMKKCIAALKNALGFMRFPISVSYFFRTLEYPCEYLLQLGHQYYIRQDRSPTMNTRARDYMSKCLATLCNALMIQGKWRLAKLVALRNLNYLSGRKQSLIELCNAYSNAIDIFRCSGNFFFCRKLETAAAKNCIIKCRLSTALEVIAFARLNASIMNARCLYAGHINISSAAEDNHKISFFTTGLRLISGSLTAAGELGEIAVKFCESISSYEIEWYTISKVTLTMMMLGKLNKAAWLILLLPVQNIWRHILSLEFILETGFVIDSNIICVNAILETLNASKTIDMVTYNRAVSALFVWFSRIGDFEKAGYWRRKLPQMCRVPLPSDAVDEMIFVMKILEGDLLNLNCFADGDSRKTGLNKRIDTLIQALRKSTKKTNLIRPRYLHLRAYEQYKLGNVEKAILILDEIKDICKYQNNLLERLWASHSRKVWTNTCDFDIDLWLASTKFGKFMKWTKCHDPLSWKNYMYSLK